MAASQKNKSNNKGLEINLSDGSRAHAMSWFDSQHCPNKHRSKQHKNRKQRPIACHN